NLRKAYHSLLISLYHFIRFLLRNWIVIVVIIILGWGMGSFIDSRRKEKKQSTLLVQINFDATAYVYNSIDVLNAKIGQKDSVFLKKYGFWNAGHPLLEKVNIEPEIDLSDLFINKDPKKSDYIKSVLEGSKFDEDILKNPVLRPEYKTHKIELIVGEDGENKVYQTVLKYINTNKALNAIKDITIKNTEKIIAENENSVAYI